MILKRFLGILIIILVLSVGAVSANENTTVGNLTDTITIDSFNDEDNFQKIIDDAKENDIIEINTTIEPYIIININKNITLKGTSNNSAIHYVSFNIAKGDVTFENLAFKSPITNYLIEGKNERLNLINCTFENYITFSGKALILTDCTVKNTFQGLSATEDEVKINNCLFENVNQPLSVYDTKLTWIDSTMKNCRYALIENGEAVITNNRFHNSSATFQKLQITLQNNIFESSYTTINSPEKHSIKNNSFISSKLFGLDISQISGCEFIASTVNVEKCGSLRDCIFRDISTDENCIRVSSNFQLTNCSFTNNSCTHMFTTPDGGKLQITDCLFENNTGEYLIYGDYFNTLELKNIRFYTNSFTQSMIGCIESENFSLTSSQFKSNTAGKSLIGLKEIQSIKIYSNVISQNICPKTIDMGFLDYHIDYNAKITTSFEMRNNIFMENYDSKGKASKIFLSPKIASNAIKMKWGTKLNLNNNYFGYNILNIEELNYYSPVEFKLRVTSWKTLMNLVNVKLVKTDHKCTLRFVDADENLVKMPDCKFTIMNGTEEIEISTKDGQGSFKFNGTPSNSQILNEAGLNIEKPKATITFEKSGSRYYDFAVNIYLKDGSAPIANGPVNYRIYIYSKSGKLLDTLEDSMKTSLSGKFTLKTFPAPDNVDHYSIKVTFANENYSLSQKTLKNIKILKTKTTIKAAKVTNKYKKSQYFQVNVKNKDTGKAVKNVYIKLKIDKKTYNVKTNSKGTAKFNTKNLKIGKHNVVISSGNQKFSMSAKSTITIKK